VFISGVAFLILTLTGVRQLVVSVIPHHLFAAVAGGIGLLHRIYRTEGGRDRGGQSGDVRGAGQRDPAGPALALFGLLVIGTLAVWNVRAAMLIGRCRDDDCGLVHGHGPSADRALQPRRAHGHGVQARYSGVCSGFLERPGWR